MRFAAAIPTILSFGMLAACAPNYSQSASDFATGVSDVSVLSGTLRQNEADSRQLYLTARSIADHDVPEMTRGCDGAADPATCFVSGRSEQARQRMRQQDAGPDLRAAIGASFPPARSYRDVLKLLDLPQACVAELDREIRDPMPPATAAKKPAEPTEAAILSVLDDYAKGLAAITKKSDLDDFKASAAKLGAAVGTLASTVGTAAGGAGAAVVPVAKAVTGLGTRAYLGILEMRRYEALKSVVLAACVPVNNIAMAEGIVASAHLANTRRNYSSVLDVMRALPASSPYLLQIRPLALQAAAGLRSSGGDPKNIARKLAETHKALVVAVTSGEGQTEALLATVGDFANDVKALKDAAKAAGNPAPSSAK